MLARTLVRGFVVTSPCGGSQVSKKAVDKLMQLKKDLAGTPGYDFVLMADTTKLGKGKGQGNGQGPAEWEPIKGLDASVIRVWFDEPVINEAYPEVHDLWYTYKWKDDQGGDHAGYVCCGYAVAVLWLCCGCAVAVL